MKPLWAILLAATIVVGSTPTARGQDLSANQVSQAIGKAVAYLKQQQKPDGTWREEVGFPGGVTSLVTLALLQAGVPKDDPQVVKALDCLRRVTIDKENSRTYVVSLQTMVFCMADPNRDRLQIAANVAWLESIQISTGDYKGAWGYGKFSDGDHSNTQFALLALHEAQRVGVPVQSRTWRLAKAHWEGCQNADGSWGYKTDANNLQGTGSMTSAGIAALVITGGKVFEPDAQVDGDRIACCGHGESNDDRIARALNWLQHHFSVTGNPGGRGTKALYYYLYGVERVGRMTAQRFIGGHDWYREGTDLLLRTQDAWSGFWIGSGSREENPLVATSFAVLFLSKGRRPVLLAKLKNGPTDDWNQHRSDVSHLTQFVEKRWKRDLSWQVVDLAAASVDDLLQTPVLYLCGSTTPLPQDAKSQDEFAAKLRDYLDRGGFLFAEAYCGGTGFDAGFRQLMEKTFPEPEYRLHMLPPEHPIWRAEEDVPPDQVRPLQGIEFGCRTSVVYAPLDPPASPRPSLSCLWELGRTERETKYASAVESQVQAALVIGTNILAYATNRQLKYKDEIPRVLTAKAQIDAVDRGRLRIAKIRHLGGCDAAPRALTNLLEAASTEQQLRVSTDQTMIDLADPSLFDYHLVFMHGRNRFRLSESERRALRTFVERGGVLFADAICGSAAFVESFRREMREVFGDTAMKAIPPGDPLLTPEFGGYDLAHVTRRVIRSGGDPAALADQFVEGPPVLEAIEAQGRYGVIFSPYDLSCALEKHNSAECQGYPREDAARIGLNVILYSLH